MRGRVAADGSEPLITIHVRDGRGGEAPLQAVIDTGFTGQLALPPDVAESLSLRFQGHGTATLADGHMERFEVYRATIAWHDRPHPVVVYAVPGFPLVGMEMLRGSELRVRAVPDGRVEIEELA